ncbi:MAG: DUF1579 domain-containing protein [Bacteroidetes bacterium]|nr:DUF1579 domain-containing protein [Bacteroidota bacterium]
MKKLIFIILLFSFYAINSFAQNDDMKKWMDYMTPGKEQQAMAKLNGDWNFTSKFWMDPAGEPQTSTGTAKFESLLGGRYSQLKVAGKMMGMDFEGIGVTGYDNGKKKYYSTWVDNFGTGIMTMEGVYDENSKQTIYTGKSFDPISNSDMDMKQTVKVINDNTCEMEMFSIVNGKEFKNMEITYTRK